MIFRARESLHLTPRWPLEFCSEGERIFRSWSIIHHLHHLFPSLLSPLVLRFIFLIFASLLMIPSAWNPSAHTNWSTQNSVTPFGKSFSSLLQNPPITWTCRFSYLSGDLKRISSVHISVMLFCLKIEGYRDLLSHTCKKKKKTPLYKMPMTSDIS